MRHMGQLWEEAAGCGGPVRSSSGQSATVMRGDDPLVGQAWALSPLHNGSIYSTYGKPHSTFY